MEEESYLYSLPLFAVLWLIHLEQEEQERRQGGGRSFVGEVAALFDVKADLPWSWSPGSRSTSCDNSSYHI